MRHGKTLSLEHLEKLKKSKQHWCGGADPVSTAGVRVMEFTPLTVAAHPRQQDMDAYRKVRSLYA